MHNVLNVQNDCLGHAYGYLGYAAKVGESSSGNESLECIDTSRCFSEGWSLLETLDMDALHLKTLSKTWHDLLHDSPQQTT